MISAEQCMLLWQAIRLCKTVQAQLLMPVSFSLLGRNQYLRVNMGDIFRRLPLLLLCQLHTQLKVGATTTSQQRWKAIDRKVRLDCPMVDDDRHSISLDSLLLLATNKCEMWGMEKRKVGVVGG